MKDHEVEMLKRFGKWSEPETNDEINESLRWYYNTIRFRNHDSQTGILNKMSFREFDDFYNEFYTYLDRRYLLEMCNAFDHEYIGYAFKKRRQEIKNK